MTYPAFSPAYGTYTVRRLGDRAWLLTGDDTSRPTDLVTRLASTLPEGFTARPGLQTVMIESKTPRTDGTAVQAALDLLATETSTSTSIASTSAPVITIPVTYNGEDLAAVAAHLQISVEDLIVLHSRTTWRVALIGFAPGFPYLVPDRDSTPADIDVTRFADVPRLTTPRVRVPAGSVAIAAGMSAIYPEEMPGGWNLLGHTDVTLFDITNGLTPSLLQAGHRVQFHPKEDNA
jgi:KipI family sensor histidine kinase inhibitor